MKQEGSGTPEENRAAPRRAVPRRAVVSAWVLWLLLALAFVLELQGRSFDDFFITYRYAWNLTAGEGFVFNPGERVFGLTNPGLALLFAAVHWLTRIPIPWLGPLSMAAGLLALAGLGLRQLPGWWPEALLGGTLVVGSSYLWMCNGGGAVLGLVSLWLAARLMDRRPTLAGGLAGLAVWARPDAVLGVGLVVLLGWIETRRIPWKTCAAAAVTVLAGLAAAWGYFGTFLPNTLAAKRALVLADPHGSSGAAAFWAQAASAFRQHAGPLSMGLVVLGILGQGPLFVRAGRGGRALILYAAALAVAYSWLGVPFFPWYVVPCLVMLLFGSSQMLGVLARRAAAGWQQGHRLAGSLALIAFLVALTPVASLVHGSWHWYRSFEGYSFAEAYRRAGEWIRADSRPGDDIAYHEVGALAYASHRHVYDLLGVVTPETLPYVVVSDLQGAFLLRPTRYVVFHSRRGVRSITRRRWFRRAYEEVARLEVGTPSEPARLVIFRRRPGASVPPPRPPRLPAPATAK